MHRQTYTLNTQDSFLNDKLLLPRVVPIVYLKMIKSKKGTRCVHNTIWKPRKILAFHLLRCTTEQDLKRIFSVFGRITAIDLMLNDFNEECYNHAYITFESKEGARRAINSKYRIWNEKKLRIAAEKDPHNYLPDKYTSTPPQSVPGSASSSQIDLFKALKSANTHLTPSPEDNYFNQAAENARYNAFATSQSDSEDELYSYDDSTDDEHYLDSD